ncbi:translation initiation factor IF-2 isoform X2 [Betta splendens]|uniref:Translation initiation factor IF-2 isoform X2 n=1 Tax=Betta splendens TaxID=158456 RepID=A0A6P7PCN1_BETSP|nr:translation initiation factor IF-2 isoform X2 [Betta splendens]
MLQQILTEMYIDPDVLDALNEDQKKTLFLKMRQEQVRRWKEREEKLESEAGEAKKPIKDNRKSVSWLLGRDGDVAVMVIGEVDELSSRFICSGLGGKKPPTLQDNAYVETILKSKAAAEPVRAERESPVSQPGVSLDPKGEREEGSASLPLPVSVSEHLSPPAAEKSPGASGEKSGLQSAGCTGNPARAPHFMVRPASANAAPGPLSTRSDSPRAATPSSAPSNTSTAGNSQEPRKTQGGKEASPAPSWTGRGRVAQLTKAFSADASAAPTPGAPRGVKPPLPSKPSHLRLGTTPTVSPVHGARQHADLQLFPSPIRRFASVRLQTFSFSPCLFLNPKQGSGVMG